MSGEANQGDLMLLLLNLLNTKLLNRRFTQRDTIILSPSTGTWAQRFSPGIQKQAIE